MLLLLTSCDLFSHSFEPFEHREHGAHRDEADCQEHCPGYPDRIFIINQRTNKQHKVTQGGGAEPETLAETLHVLGGYFRYEREAEG